MQGWSQRHNIGALLAIAACVFLTGFIGAQFTSTSVNSWYTTIQKPSWNPPSWVFGPVWTALYILIAVSGWLLWRRRAAPLARTALILFAIQLALNTLWSALFFGMQSPGLAAVEITLLWLAIGAYIATAFRTNRTAAWLFIPYWLWVSFAAVLNFTIFFLNS